jgi:hypothetical protein
MINPVTLSTAGGTFTLNDGEEINDSSVAAQITVAALNTTLNINGTVTGAANGIRVNATASTALAVGATGVISGSRAIELNGGVVTSSLSEISIINAGTINGCRSNALFITGNVAIENTGIINAAPSGTVFAYAINTI